jgi:hypothetical protein
VHVKGTRDCCVTMQNSWLAMFVLEGLTDEGGWGGGGQVGRGAILDVDAQTDGRIVSNAVLLQRVAILEHLAPVHQLLRSWRDTFLLFNCTTQLFDCAFSVWTELTVPTGKRSAHPRGMPLVARMRASSEQAWETNDPRVQNPVKTEHHACWVYF